MSKKVIDWLTVIGAGAPGASAVLLAADHMTGKIVALASFAFLGGVGLAAKALYSQKPGT
jgi:hypothetical protein